MVWKTYLLFLILCCNGDIPEETNFQKIIMLSRNSRAAPIASAQHPTAPARNATLAGSGSGGGSSNPASVASSGGAGGGTSSGGYNSASPKPSGNVSSEPSGVGIAKSGSLGGGAPSGGAGGSTPSGSLSSASLEPGNLSSEPSGGRTVKTGIPGAGAPLGGAGGSASSGGYNTSSPKAGNVSSEPSGGGTAKYGAPDGGGGSTPSGSHSPAVPNPGDRSSEPSGGRTAETGIPSVGAPSGGADGSTPPGGGTPVSPTPDTFSPATQSGGGPAKVNNHYMVHFLQLMTGGPSSPKHGREHINSNGKKQQPESSGAPDEKDPANVYVVHFLQLLTGSPNLKKPEQAKSSRSQRDPTPLWRREPRTASPSPSGLPPKVEDNADVHYHYMVHFLQRLTKSPNAKRLEHDKREQQKLQVTESGRMARAASWGPTLPPTKQCGDLPSPKVTKVDPTARTWYFTHPAGTWVCTDCNRPNGQSSTVTKYRPFFTPFTFFTGDATPLPPPTRAQN